jgi:hypothetical protein
MKKTLFYLAIASLSFLACTKNDNTNPSQSGGGTSGVSTTVFYADTFRIYSTDLKGGNRKLVVDEDIKSGNNYIGYVSVRPGAQQLVYSYTKVYTEPQQIKISKFDGSDKRILKTLPSGSYVGFLKFFTDGNIFYSVVTNNGPTISVNLYSIQADGTGEKVITLPLYSNVQNPDLASADGKGILDQTGYFAVFANGTFDERNSFNIFLNEDKTKIKEVTLSNDATKAAFIQSTATPLKYEVRIKDVKAAAPTATVLYTITLTGGVSDSSPTIHFVNGSKNLLISYGKSNTGRLTADGYTVCELIDTATGKLVDTWKFTGDDIYRPTTD